MNGEPRRPRSGATGLTVRRSIRSRCFMTLDDLQAHIERMYSDKDRERGPAPTFLWFCEEVGELAGSI